MVGSVAVSLAVEGSVGLLGPEFVGGGMVMDSSIWQRTRTSLGLWQREQGLRWDSGVGFGLGIFVLVPRFGSWEFPSLFD